MYNKTIFSELIKSGRSSLKSIQANERCVLRTLRKIQLNSKLFPVIENPKPMMGVYSSGGAYISYYLPWDKTLVDNLILTYLKLGWVIASEENNVAVNQYYEFNLRHPLLDDKVNGSFRVAVYMMASQAESKCRLEVDHTEMVEKTFWKVICEDPLSV